MDKLRKQTDKELEKLEQELREIYEQAKKDLSEKWDKYMAKVAKDLKPLEEAYKAAKESGDQNLISDLGRNLGVEKQKATIRDSYYRAMVQQTAARYSDVNEIAVAYTNDQMPKIYAMNYNGTIQGIRGEAAKIGQYSFDLVDEQTVKNLAKSDTSLFPQKTIDRAKDLGWNLKAINSQVMQGILQGESISDIAKRLENVTEMNSEAAVRNARTMTTATENNGRLSGIRAAEEEGLVYEKQWMATHDGRTRESHQLLDGESVPTDEEFGNGLMYPGDPDGEPEEVYNCRCSLVRNLIGFRRKDGSISKVGDIKRYDPDYFE